MISSRFLKADNFINGPWISITFSSVFIVCVFSKQTIYIISLITSFEQEVIIYLTYIYILCVYMYMIYLTFSCLYIYHSNTGELES